jgi:hypothetical protein
MHRQVVRKMGSLEVSWRRFEKGQRLIYGSAIRQKAFARAKRSSERLGRQTSGLLLRSVPDERLDGDPLNTIKQMGGMKMISLKASAALGMLDEVSEALEQDVRELDMGSFEEQERRFRPYGRLLGMLKWGSLALTAAGAFVSLGLSRITGDEAFHGLGLQIGVIGLGTAFLFGLAKEKAEELFRPGIAEMRDAVEHMKGGLRELKRSLPELVESVSIFSK